MRPLYLDYAATTPVAPQVVDAMAACWGSDGCFGNPASGGHVYGQQAAAAVVQAQTQVAALIGAAPQDIIFTSGATEANNLALKGAAAAYAGRGRHLVSSRSEHKSVLAPLQWLEQQGWSVSWLAPGADGCIAVADVAAALREDTQLVSLMHVNNETGALLDIAAVAALCRQRGVRLHVDAAQSAGRLPLDVMALGVDYLSFSAHKLYGPMGIGALYRRRLPRARLEPQQHGGGQQAGLRAGTLPTALIAGFGVACALAARDQAVESQRLYGLRERLWAGLQPLQPLLRNGAPDSTAPHLLNISFPYVNGEALLLGMPELAVATGSACTSASAEPSYVLRALGRSDAEAESAIRFSFGRATMQGDIDQTIEVVSREVQRLRAISPRWAAHVAV